MSQDTNIENLIINKLTKAQYENIENPDPTQLYFITDEVISSEDVVNALGYTPYNATNPNGYTSNIGTVTSVNNAQPDINGNVTLTIPDTATWGNITGTLSNQTDLHNALNNKYDASNPDGFISGIDSTDVTTALGYTPYNATNPNGFISSASVSSLTDVNLTNVANNQALLYNFTTQKWENKDVTIIVDSALDSTSTNPVENRVIAQALEGISLAKNPNLNLIGGNLNIDSGNVSGFSITDYMQFPFVFNFNGYHWILEKGFTTGSDVTTQQNILDSYYGIAFAIRNGRFVLAISSNGSLWDIANVDGTYSVQANTAYSVKIAWDGTNYTLSYALDETNYTTDITVASALVHHSTQEYVGGEPNLYGDSSQHPFSGTINLNNWKLTVNGLEVWLGMDDVGLGSRANIDLSNLTEAGQYMVDTVKDQNNGSRIKTWTGTKVQYDAIVTKDSNTLYNITDDTDVTFQLLELLFPIGAVYFGTMSTCPLQTLGIGTWQALPQDKVIQIAGTRGDVNTTLNESLPNITGHITSLIYPNGYQGAFTEEYQTTGKNAWGDGSFIDSGVIFNAHNSNSTYQDNAPVQQDAYLLNGWRRIA